MEASLSRRGRAASALALASFLIVGAGFASAQSYPNRPIRIVTSAPGSGADSSLRVITPRLAEDLGQQIVIDNRGGSTIIPAEIVAKAPADGYTLLYVGSSHWLLPFMRDNVPYHPVRDFAPVTLTVNSPSVLVVHPSLPATSVKELVALAKARPGELNYGTGPSGTSNHLSGELFNTLAGVNIVRVPYKGTAPALVGLLSGQVQLMFSPASSVMPQVKSGKLRALGVTSPRPSPVYPELPTIAAAGLAGYESLNVIAIMAPAKTPGALVALLNRSIVQVLNRPEVKDRFTSGGVEVVASSPNELAAHIKDERERWGKIIKDAGIRDQ